MELFSGFPPGRPFRLNSKRLRAIRLVRRAVRRARTVPELKVSVPRELLFDYAIHVRRCALAQFRLRKFWDTSKLEVSLLNEQFGLVEDLQLLYLSRVLDSVESSSVDRRMASLIFQSHPSATYGISGGAFRKIIDFQRISQEFGNVSSYLARSEGFLDESRREKFVDYVNRRHRIIITHLNDIYFTFEEPAHVHYYFRYLYKFLEALFYYHTPTYWHFFSRYGSVRLVVWDIPMVLNLIIFCFYLGHLYFSFVEFLLFHGQGLGSPPLFFEFLLWRSHFLFGEAFYCKYVLTPLLLVYPTLALPLLILLSLLPQPSNYYFGKNFVPYSNRIFLATTLFNFFSVFILVSSQYLFFPIAIYEIPVSCELDSFFFRLDFLLSFFYNLYGCFDLFLSY